MKKPKGNPSCVCPRGAGHEQAPSKSPSEIVPNGTTEHVYTAIAETEREEILDQLQQSQHEDIRMRLDELIEVYSAGKGGHGLDLEMADSEALDSSIGALTDYYRQAMGKCVLLKDEQGICWLVKSRNPDRDNPDWMSGWIQNVRRREHFAHLLLRNTSNQAEIRKLTEEDAQHSPDLAPFAGSIDEHYLSRLVMDGNMDCGWLPHDDIRQADSAMFVSDILIRKYDAHMYNRARLNSASVSLDNDFALESDWQIDNPRDSLHFKRFEFFFLMTFATEPVVRAKTWKAREGSPTRQFESTYQHFLWKNMALDPEKAVNEISSLMRDYGLGDCIIAANMLDERYMRESILEHKRIENIRQTAIEAGYTGRDLDEVVAMIEENLETLGRDVNEVLKAITGRDYRFDRM
ncbi:hypothetical protein ACFLQU_04350 [Verrucomicrobiota bacterium]